MRKEELDIGRLTRFISYYWMSQYAVSYPRTSKFYDPYFKKSIRGNRRSIYVTENTCACWKKRGGRQDDSLRKQGFKNNLSLFSSSEPTDIQ